MALRESFNKTKFSSITNKNRYTLN